MTDNFSKRVVATLKDLRSSINDLQEEVGAGASYSSEPPENPEIGQLWIDSDYEVPSISFYQRWTKTLTGTESAFSGTQNDIELEYTPGLESVFLNGVLLVRGADYTATNGSTVTLTVAGQNGDVIEIISPNTLDIANVYNKDEIDSALLLKADASSLSAKANIDSPTFTGVPSAPTAAAATNTTQIATTAFVRTEVSNIVNSAPSTLDTLDELAAALGDDANFATTVTNSIASKQKLILLQNSAPTSPSTGDLWVDNTDTAKPILKSYNGSSWVEVGSTVEADSDQIILSTRMFA